MATQIPSYLKNFSAGRVLLLDVTNANRPSRAMAVTAPAQETATRYCGSRGNLFLLTRSAARCALSMITGAPIASFDILSTGDGAPKVVRKAKHGGPNVATNFSISFSYADNRALVGLSREGRLGIDIERNHSGSRMRRRDFDAIRQYYFERPVLGSDKQRSSSLLDIALPQMWVRHEALHKALGLGLEYPAADIDPVSEGIRVTDLLVGNGYVAALATDFVPKEIRIEPAIDILARGGLIATPTVHST